MGSSPGLYRWGPAPAGTLLRAAVLFSGTANLAARKAQAELADHYGVGVELWSATSYSKLRAEALSVERWNRLASRRTAQVAGRHQDPVRSRRPDRGGVGLHEDGSRPDRPICSRGIHDARHRRVRPIRQPQQSSPLLRNRRRSRRDRRALGLVREGKLAPQAMADAVARYGIDPEAIDPEHFPKKTLPRKTLPEKDTS